MKMMLMVVEDVKKEKLEKEEVKLIEGKNKEVVKLKKEVKLKRNKRKVNKI